MSIRELFVYLRARDADKAIAFYIKAFGAEEKFRLVEPSGRVGHAELAFGDASVYISDEFPELNVMAPKPNEPATFITHLHVDNADELINQAVDAGAELLRAPEDQFFGERSGTIRDPFGYEWLIGHSLEKVETDEMQRRYSEMLS